MQKCLFNYGHWTATIRSIYRIKASLQKYIKILILNRCCKTSAYLPQTSSELQKATLAYDKANSAHAAAREMVYLAEQGLARLAEGSEGGLTLDPAWQEMLNHATQRVNQVRLVLIFSYY